MSELFHFCLCCGNELCFVKVGTINRLQDIRWLDREVFNCVLTLRQELLIVGTRLPLCKLTALLSASWMQGGILGKLRKKTLMCFPVDWNKWHVLCSSVWSCTERVMTALLLPDGRPQCYSLYQKRNSTGSIFSSVERIEQPWCWKSRKKKSKPFTLLWWLGHGICMASHFWVREVHSLMSLEGKNLSSSCDLLDESSQHMFSAWVIETLKYIWRLWQTPVNRQILIKMSFGTRYLPFLQSNYYRWRTAQN